MGMKFAESTGGSGSWKNGKAVFANKEGTQKWKVTFEDKEVYKFLEDLLPEFPAKVMEGKEYYVSLIREKDSEGSPTDVVKEVESIRPMKWRDELVLVVDATRIDDEPSFYSKKNTYDESKPEIRMVNWFLEFQEGDYKGVRVPYNVHYRFQPDTDGNASWDFTQYQYEYPKSTRIHQCVEFYDKLMDVLSPPIEWTEDGNIIPALLARILDKKQYLIISGVEGWIDDKYTEKTNAPVTINEEVEARLEQVTNTEPLVPDILDEDDEW